jgi:hypothetical protein
MSRKVTHAQFHQSVFIKAAGNIGNSLPSGTKNYNEEMSHTPEGLLIKIGKIESLVPWANVIVCTYAPEETK